MIVACDEAGGIARGGEIPWNYKEDWEHFKATTKGAACIMGRRTYQDIWDRKPANSKSKKTLVGRDTYVVTSNTNLNDFKGVEGIGTSFQTIIDKMPDGDQPIFILGGEKLYVQTIVWASKVVLTVVPGIHNCDRFFPVDYLHANFKITDGRKCEESGLMFVTYHRRSNPYHETRRDRKGAKVNTWA
jgi:dihydrofolate reductase